MYYPIIVTLNILFTLIYKHVHVQAKEDGHSALKSVTKFGLEDLFRHFFEEDEYPGIVYLSYTRMYYSVPTPDSPIQLT